MNTTDEQKQQLLNRLQIGISYQLLLLFVEEAFVLEKEETVKSLSDLFQQFVLSLSDAEKEKFGAKVAAMLENKAGELQTSLEENVPADELESVKEELQHIAAADKV